MKENKIKFEHWSKFMRLYSCWLCRHRVGAVLTTRLRRHHIPRSRLLCRHYNDQLEASHWKIRQNICVCWHTQPMYPIAKFLTLENRGLPMAKFCMSAVVVDYMNSWILNFAIEYTRKNFSLLIWGPVRGAQRGQKPRDTVPLGYTY